MLPEVNLHLVPDSVATDAAVFTEPLAAACEILDQVAIPRGGEVAVLGTGKLGLLIAQVLEVAAGCEVHRYGRNTDKPEAAYDWVVDATGNPEGLKQAIRMVRPRGTIVMKSTVQGEVAIDTAAVIVNEITLVGSRCGSFAPALELLRSGKIDPTPMIAGRFALAAAPQAFEHAARKGVLKVLLQA